MAMYTPLEILRKCMTKPAQKEIDLEAVLKRGTCVSSLPSIRMEKTFNLAAVSSEEKCSRDLLANRFIVNIWKQKLRLSRDTWLKILDLYSHPKPGGLTRIDEVRLELFYLHSTINAGSLFEGKCHAIQRRLSKENIFERVLVSFLYDTLSSADVYLLAKVEYTFDLKIREFLKSASVMSAFQKHFNTLNSMNELTKSSFTKEWLTKAIDNMRIYATSRMYGELRGGVVRDGIYFCKASLVDAGCSKFQRLEADSLTLAANLTAHYLPRLLMNDFDHPTIFNATDLGAEVEREIFGGNRVDWFITVPEAADEFLNRVVNPATVLPIIGAGEFPILEVRCRNALSIPFAGELNYRRFSMR